MTPETPVSLNSLPEVSIDFDWNEKSQRLYDGLRDRNDPVTWRTTIMTIGELLGVKNPENDEPSHELYETALTLTKAFVKDTYSEPLLPEILYAVGFDQALELKRPDLDVLLVNARHKPEALLWTTADYLKQQGKKVAVLNPVGHYNDVETRIVGPNQLLRHVDTTVFMASTQTQKGGNLEVLMKTLELLNNPNFTGNITSTVCINVPMWGGSRGHRVGQRLRAGYEVLEAPTSTKHLSQPLARTMKYVAKNAVVKIPDIVIQSTDIHNLDSIKSGLKAFHFKFENLDPSGTFATAILDERRNQNIMYLPMKIISCDKGSEKRTEKLTQSLLADIPLGSHIDTVYVKKDRKKAGEVADAKVDKVVRWTKDSFGNISKRTLKKGEGYQDDCHMILTDDMLDTGSSVKTDKATVSKEFINAKKWWVVGTHPILSKGANGLSEVGIDLFIFGNTLSIDTSILAGLKREVDMAPTIASGLLGLTHK